LAALSAATVRGEGTGPSPERRDGPGLAVAAAPAAVVRVAAPRGAIGRGVGALPPGRAGVPAAVRGAEGFGAEEPPAAGPGRGCGRGAVGLGVAAGLACSVLDDSAPRDSALDGSALDGSTLEDSAVDGETSSTEPAALSASWPACASDSAASSTVGAGRAALALVVPGVAKAAASAAPLLAAWASAA
jgi:hypothetical protein